MFWFQIKFDSFVFLWLHNDPVHTYQGKRLQPLYFAARNLNCQKRSANNTDLTFGVKHCSLYKKSFPCTALPVCIYFSWKITYPKQFFQVIKLPMDVTTHLKRRERFLLHLHHQIIFNLEEITCFLVWNIKEDIEKYLCLFCGSQ